MKSKLEQSAQRTKDVSVRLSSQEYADLKQMLDTLEKNAFKISQATFFRLAIKNLIQSIHKSGLQIIIP